MAGSIESQQGGGATTTPSLEGELKGVREYQGNKTPAIPGGWH